jgi:hypothetical protein
VVGWPGIGMGMFTHPVPAVGVVTLWGLLPII